MRTKELKILEDRHTRLLTSVDPLLKRIRDLSEAYTARKQEQRFRLFSSTNPDRLEKIDFIRSVADSFHYYRGVPDNFVQLSVHVITLGSAKPAIYGACLFVMKEIGSTYYLGSPSSSELYSELDDILGDVPTHDELDYLNALREYLSDDDHLDKVHFGSTNRDVVLEKLAAYTETTYTEAAAAAAP